MPAAAQARPRIQPLLDLPPLRTDFRDAVPTGAHAAAAAGLARAADDGDPSFSPYATKEGYSVGVAVSPSYAPDPSVTQTYVDFLDSLPHGAELRKLRVYIAPPSEVLSLCGGAPGTLACYLATPQLMVVPGEQSTDSDVSVSYVVTHEYGHHIANNRSNPPFNAFTFGPKYWASYELVCDRAAKHELAPGDEGDLYASNPGEGWADTYAHIKYRDVGWQFSDLLKPDDGAFAAAAKDVGDLWHGPAVRTLRGGFGAHAARTRSFSFPVTLDGALGVQLRGPKKSNYDLTLRSDDGSEQATRATGSRDVINDRVACRTRQTENLTLTVTRRRGSGPFSVRVSYAG